MNSNDIYEFYKTLLAGDYGIWVLLPSSGTLYFNEAYLTMLGYPKKKFPFQMKTWRELVHPENRDGAFEKLTQVCEGMAQGNSYEYRYRMRAADGSDRWILGKGFVLCRNRHNQAKVIVGVHIDLEKLTAILEGTTLQNDRVRFAMEAGQDGLWDWNTDTNEVYYSPRYTAMLGYTPEEFPMRLDAWSNRMHPDDRIWTVQQQVRIIESTAFGDTFECVYRLMDAAGEYRWILGRGKVFRRNAAGKATRLVGLHTDITELRQAQESLTQLINYDVLTRLYSRFAFDEALKSVREEDYPVSIIYGDIDGLKLVNDNLGHSVGDAMLMEGARIIRDVAGDGQMVARVGGDEIAVLLTRCPPHEGQNIMARMRIIMERHNESKAEPPVFVSLGFASAELGTPVASVIALADKDMLQEKQRCCQHNRAVLKNWIESQREITVDMVDPRVR